MNKRLSTSLGAVAVLAGALASTAPANAAVPAEETVMQPTYQLCNSGGGYNVCIERDAEGWHARAWGPGWVYAALYNNGHGLESTNTPPGGQGIRTGGYPEANVACASRYLWSGDYVCVSPHVKK